MNKQTNDFFKPEDLISVYTSDQAVDDGILFDLDQLSHRKLSPSKAAKTPLKFATINLLSNGYFNEDKSLNIPNIMDMLTQANIILNRKPADDYFVTGHIELPSGSKRLIYIAQNETGRYTIMLPEDY